MLPNDLSTASGAWLNTQLAQREARRAEINTLDASERNLDELFELEAEIDILKVVIQTRERSPSPLGSRRASATEGPEPTQHEPEHQVLSSGSASPAAEASDMWPPRPPLPAHPLGPSSSSRDAYGSHGKAYAMPGAYMQDSHGSRSNPISRLSSSASSPRMTPDHVSLDSSSSNAPPNRKRHLSSPNGYQDEHRSKLMRHSISPTDSQPITPFSRDSSSAPEDVQGWLLEMLGDSEEVRAQIREMRRMEQSMAEKRERERQDEEFARRLQAELNQPDAPGPSALPQPVPPPSQGAPRFQSHFDPNGDWRREPPMPLPPAPPAPITPSERPPVQYPQLPPQQNFGIAHPPPNIHREHGQTARTDQPPHYISSDESDSDLSVITPNIYSQNATNRPPGLHPYGSSPITQRSRPLPPYNPIPYQGSGGSSVYGSMSNPVGSLMNGLSSMASAFGGSLGLPPWSSQGGMGALPDHLNNMWDHFTPQYPRPHPYGDDYADPKETEKELKDLMDNIRPDEELGLTDRTGSPEDMADGCGLYEHQKLGLAWMTKMEEGTNKGGILADDMGLGKTIQAIALMVSRRSDDMDQKTNLVVAPLALLKQWENEIDIKIRRNKRLSVYIYHGTKKTSNWAQLKKHDVILTTYGTLGAEFTRMEALDKFEKENPQHPRVNRSAALPLLGPDSKFYRVILDEAQNIKNKQTKAFRAASALQSQYRFCMTGTPMMNGVEELYSLISFLKIRPYNNYSKFSMEILRPLKERRQSMSDSAMRKLQALLKAILLRRTKKSEIDGRPILTLPERTTTIEHAVMEGDQLEFYRALETQTQIRFNRYLKAGTVGRNYHGVLVLLLRLRQTCCHPHLIRNAAEEVAGTADKTPDELERIAREHLGPEVVKRLIEEGQVDCPICMDAVENSTIFTPCGHATCSECFTRVSDPTQGIDDGTDRRNNTFKCMNCRGPVDPTKVTDWNSFKKVHIDADEGAEAADEAEKDGDNVSDSETESEDSESETDSLDGFIVDDEKVDKKARDLKRSPKLIKDAPSLDGAAESDTEKKAVKKILSDADDEDFKPSKGKGKSKADKKPKKTKKKRKGKGKEKLDIKLKNPTLAQLQREANRNLKAKRMYFAKLKEEFVTSAKIDKCLEILERIATERPGEKTIVFSQFTTFLDLIEVPITERGYSYKRYDGSMSAGARNDAVLEFTMRRNCRLMLVSLKAGNSGLNLTAANNVIILDPFWNPYIEEQAIDRVHRIGQRLPVNCYRILVEGTVEDRIMDIQERKRAVIEGALDESASKGIARLTQRDLAYLFGVSS